MKHDQFIGQVQARARLSSRGDAERMTRATLETLGERIPEGLAENIAAQLPAEIGEYLRPTLTWSGTVRPQRFDRDEFIARVSSRSTTDEPLAAYGIRVVLELVAEATSAGLMAKLQESLPNGLREPLLAGSSGDVR